MIATVVDAGNDNDHYVPQKTNTRMSTFGRKSQCYHTPKCSPTISMYKMYLSPAIIGPNTTGDRLQTMYSIGWQ